MKLRSRLVAVPAVLAASAAVLLTMPGAQAATTVKASYTAQYGLTAGEPIHGLATLRHLSSKSSTYWLAWTSVRGLEKGRTYKNMVFATRADGRFLQVEACSFVAKADGTGSCSGKVSMPAGVTNRQSALFITGGRDDFNVAQAYLRPAYAAQLSGVGADGSGPANPTGTSTLRQFTVAKSSAGQTTTYWTASATMKNLLPQAPYLLQLHFKLADGTVKEVKVGTFTAKADGTGTRWAKVQGVPTTGVVDRYAQVFLIDGSRTEITAEGRLTPQ